MEDTDEEEEDESFGVLELIIVRVGEVGVVGSRGSGSGSGILDMLNDIISNNKSPYCGTELINGNY